MASPSFHTVIRADAGGVIGTGHVMRMMALAQALCERGAAVTFVVVRCSKDLIVRLQTEGFVVKQLADCEIGGHDDAQKTVEMAAGCNARWIVLDGYAFGPEYQLECRKDGRRLLCIDDHQYGGRWHVDVLHNQNLHALRLREKYADSARDAALWLGTDFALMRKEFWRRPHPPARRPGEMKRLLVTMGGSDASNATALIIEALALVWDVSIRVSVLVGPSNPNRRHLESLSLQHRDRFEIIDAVEHMSSLLENVDCVITAGGSTCWEILWAGKPAAVLAIADNQQPIARSLQEQGLMISLGEIGHAAADQLATQLENWLKSPPARPVSCRIDGKGARRVAAALDGCFTITIATAGEGWLGPNLESLKKSLEALGHQVRVASKPDEMTGGDFLFLLSYWGIVAPAVLDRYLHSLVVHASDLPYGRGWSPATWAILEGRNRLPVCLLEAGEKVDRGDIYFRDEIVLNGHELIDEWRESIARKTTELCLRFVREYPGVLGAREKQPEAGTYYPRRTPMDSRLDTSRTIEQLFNQLRVVDNAAYPAWFDHLGHRFRLRVEKASP